MTHPFIVALTTLFVATQALYTLAFLVDVYFLTLPVNWVDTSEPIREPPAEWPYIVLFYPVLRELEATMRTTFLALSKVDYPRERCRVVAIPNSHDTETIASLQRLATEFSFLEILIVPPTSDASWQIVWQAWNGNPKAYWWHRGRRAGEKDLPPKKTRQLIYALYHMAQRLEHEPNLVINYIDADSCPPADHFKGAVIGLKHYDVLQAQNVVGNLNATMATTWHSFDHMGWDGYKYPHLSANGRQPYWVLGKGLFYRVSDLVALGGFHPWITIEDPEIGLRYWANGKRLGILKSPLIEEVPRTWLQGITQRKRWICGFFQSLGQPLRELGLNPWQRFKCWLVFFPCLSLLINIVGLPVGAWAAAMYFARTHVVPTWTIFFADANVLLFSGLLALLYVNTWGRTGLVCTRLRDRVWYMIRINPISAMLWWSLWIIPLLIGFRMYLRDEGLAWQRTEKVDANKLLIRAKLRRAAGLKAAFALGNGNGKRANGNGRVAVANGHGNGEAAHANGHGNGEVAHANGNGNGEVAHANGNGNGEAAHANGNGNGNGNDNGHRRRVRRRLLLVLGGGAWWLSLRLARRRRKAKANGNGNGNGNGKRNGNGKQNGNGRGAAAHESEGSHLS